MPARNPQIDPALLGEWTSALAQLQRLDSLALLSHVRPDGDACGSLIAFGLALENAGKRVRLFLEDGLTERYAFLPGAARVERPPQTAPDVDAIVALDNAAAPRLGAAFTSWNKPVWLNIDHHVSNERFGALNLIDPSVPATGQILFELMLAAGWPVSPAIASNLFVAISTDTGSFKYRNTTTRTFEVAAALSAAGAPIAELSHACYGSFPLRRTKLLREILQHLAFECGERIAWYPITRAMYEDSGARAEDTEGLIESIISSEGVDVAIAFEERKNGTIKMSFRAKGRVNVNEIAVTLGGGGHREAAGAELPGPLDAAVARVLPLVRGALPK